MVYLLPTDLNLNSVGMDMNDNGNVMLAAQGGEVGIQYAHTLKSGIRFDACLDADIFWVYGSRDHFLLKRAAVEATFPVRKSSLSLNIGHDIHPLAEDSPDLFTAGAGAPFSPYGFAPQAGISWHFGQSGKYSIQACALGQSEYPSSGPENTSTAYIAYSCIPEAFLGFRYSGSSWSFALNADYLIIKPRQTAIYPFTDVTVFVNDRADALVATAFVQYKTVVGKSELILKGRGIYNRGANHLNMQGGYVCSGIDADYLMRTYSPVTTVGGWFNASFGSAMKGHLFAGYLKNLGTSDRMYSPDEIFFTQNRFNLKYAWRTGAAVSWTWSRLEIALEYDLTAARYGDRNSIDLNTALCNGNPHNVFNHAVMLGTFWTF